MGFNSGFKGLNQILCQRRSNGPLLSQLARGRQSAPVALYLQTK